MYARQAAKNLALRLRFCLRQVVDGMDVVRAMEAVGSDDGKTSAVVRVGACGQLS
jgi:hypothetical protein